MAFILVPTYLWDTLRINQVELWPQLEAMYSDYVEYRARVDGVRSIPVLVFEPQTT